MHHYASTDRKKTQFIAEAEKAAVLNEDESDEFGDTEGAG